jgi:hypothetical protein
MNNISLIEITEDTDLPRINYTNFDYEDVLGDELVTNGSFSDDSDWFKTSGWSISNGQAIANTSAYNTLQQVFPIVLGKKYQVKFDIISITSGSISMTLGSNSGVQRNQVGSYTEIIEYNSFFASSGPRSGSSGFVGSIDNVSVKEFTENVVVPYSGTGSLLLEPQSTNLVTYSEDFSQWSTLNGSSVDLNFAISPDGTQNASKFNFNGTTNGRVELQITGLTPAQPVTFSVWLKTLSGTEQVYIGHSSFGLKEVTVTDQWQRYTSSTISGAGGFAFPRVRMDSASSVLVWGYQVEELSYATSYIPTSGSTVTRNADVCNNAGSSDLINSTEGTLYGEGYFEQTGLTNGLFAISDGTFNNFLMVRFGPINKLQIEATGGINIIEPNARNYGNYKIAAKYDSNGVQLWVDGYKVVETSSQSTMSGVNQLMVGKSPYGNIVGYKNKCVAVFKEALTDEELACLTSHKQDTSFYYYVQKLKFIGATLEHFGEFYNKFKKLF